MRGRARVSQAVFAGGTAGGRGGTPGKAESARSAPRIMQQSQILGKRSGIGAGCLPHREAQSKGVFVRSSPARAGMARRFLGRPVVRPGGLPGPRRRPLASRSKLRMARSRSSRCFRNSARALAKSMGGSRVSSEPGAKMSAFQPTWQNSKSELYRDFLLAYHIRFEFSQRILRSPKKSCEVQYLTLDNANLYDYLSCSCPARAAPVSILHESRGTPQEEERRCEV